MPAYRFEAADGGGRIERGVIDADSPRHARSLLRDRGLAPLDISALQAATAAGGGVRPGRLRAIELTLATRQLASLLLARLPLERALSSVAEQAERRAVRERFAAIRSDVVAGQTLSQALEKYPRDFPEVYRALVAAGEHSGDLGLVMAR